MSDATVKCPAHAQLEPEKQGRFPAGQCPVYDQDLFTPQALQYPFGHYRAIRDLGPVVRLGGSNLYMLSRFKNVRDALRTPDKLVCSQGTGFSDTFNHPRLPSILQSDGNEHQRMRKETIRPLLPAHLQQYRASMRKMIGDRVKSWVDVGWFDGVAEIARFLPVAVISHLVGLPEQGRAAMLEWAQAFFNTVGPEEGIRDNDREVLFQWRDYLDSLEWKSLREDSWARMLEKSLAQGTLSQAEAKGAISGYVIPSLDTTILTQSQILYNLARNPDQWQMLKRDPSLLNSAAIEGVRHATVVRWFSRVATMDYEVEGFTVPQGARIMLMYASANRDEREYENPDRFDITRDARKQLAWGTGPHHCVGLHLATMEIELMLETLIEHCEVIETGEPSISSNSGLYGFTSLPLKLLSKAST